MNEQVFTLQYPWDFNGYRPKTEFHLHTDSDSFCMHIIVKEKNPRRVETEHLHYVHTDSCVEWFVNFFPEDCDMYFNFEVNANGAMYASFRKDREHYRMLSVEDLDSMQIKANVYEEKWEVSYRVPFLLIKEYIPNYSYKDGMKIQANFYKCGDEMQYPHYGMWNVYQADEPDFHRPEYFGDIILNG